MNAEIIRYDNHHLILDIDRLKSMTDEDIKRLWNVGEVVGGKIIELRDSLKWLR